LREVSLLDVPASIRVGLALLNVPFSLTALLVSTFKSLIRAVLTFVEDMGRVISVTSSDKLRSRKKFTTYIKIREFLISDLWKKQGIASIKIPWRLSDL
jgi:hypothetical protein